jgi:hypothetical protein
MTELQQDRASDQSALRGFAAGRGALPASGAVLSVRLFAGSETASAGDSAAKPSHPAQCLTADLLAASGGHPLPAHGKTLVAAFSTLQAALLAARRLQWAFQGFSEEEHFQGAAAAVLVSASQDLPGQPQPGSATADALALPLNQAAPGQILLAENAGLQLQDLPGLSIEPATNSVLRQLLWKPSAAAAQSTADEQALFRNIKQQGSAQGPNVESPSREPEPPSWEPPAPVAPTPIAQIVQPPSHAEPSALSALWPPRSPAGWALWGGLAAAGLCALALVLFIPRHQPAVPAQPPAAVTSPQPVPASAAPTASTSPSAAAPPRPAPQTAKPAASEAAQARQKKKAEEAPREKPSSAACEIPASEVKTTLARAEKNLHAGRLDDAQRDFSSIRGCEAAAGQAEEGLRLVRERRGDQ